MSSRYVIVTVIADSAETAERLAETAVADRRAARALVYPPLTSTRRAPGGQVETLTEHRVDLETDAAQVQALRMLAAEQEAAAVTGFAVTAIDEGSASYFSWISRATR